MAGTHHGEEKKEKLIRSSAAEYLTFVASTGESDTSFEMRYEDENIWLTQKMMAALYDVSKQTISQHIKRIYADGELAPEATVKKYLTVQTEGNRQISRKQDHYSLQMIIAVGFKVNNQRAVQFRKWAGQIVKDHTIQGWTMDVDRLKKRPYVHGRVLRAAIAADSGNSAVGAQILPESNRFVRNGLRL